MLKLTYNKIKSYNDISDAFNSIFSEDYKKASKVLVVDIDTLFRVEDDDEFDLESLKIFLGLGWNVVFVSEKPGQKVINLQKSYYEASEFKNGSISFTIASGEKRKSLFEQISLNNKIKAFFTDKVTDKLYIDDDCNLQYIVVTRKAYSFGCTVDFFADSLTECCFGLLDIGKNNEKEESSL